MLMYNNYQQNDHLYRKLVSFNQFRYHSYQFYVSIIIWEFLNGLFLYNWDVNQSVICGILFFLQVNISLFIFFITLWIDRISSITVRLPPFPMRPFYHHRNNLEMRVAEPQASLYYLKFFKIFISCPTLDRNRTDCGKAWKKKIIFAS